MREPTLFEGFSTGHHADRLVDRHLGHALAPPAGDVGRALGRVGQIVM